MKSNHRIWRWAWVVIWIGHALAAGVWWWMMPGGFPLGHLRFFSNALVPIVFGAAMLAALYGALKPAPTWMLLMLPVVPLAWASATVAGWILFPISSVRVLPFVLTISTMLCLRAWFMPRELIDAESPAPIKILRMSVCAMAVACGLIMPLAQRAGSPMTRPLNAALPNLDTNKEAPPTLVKLSDAALVYANGDVRTKSGGLTLEISPLLTFFSRSPDRCWTVLTKQEESMRRPLSSWRREKRAVDFQFGGAIPSVLHVSEEDGGAMKIEALTRMDEDVYSHLNTFSEISIGGHSELALEFSPCPGTRIEVLPFDYPAGRPARSAYLDAHGMFHVVEASSGEKGPYHELASGPLAKGAALSITFFDKNKACSRLVFEDWAAQASFELSPTAGWGLPSNAIEFSREGEAPASACSVFLTLAATSVGRGWDSVGHARGTYRNRMRVETVRE